MADISSTAANVKLGSDLTRTAKVQYGATVVQPNPLYLHTDNKYYPCDANDGVAKAKAVAIALTPGVADDYGIVALPSVEGADRSLVNLGATLTVGTVYAVSATVGAIAPVADISSGQFVTVIGVAKTAALLDFQVSYSTVAKA